MKRAPYKVRIGISVGLFLWAIGCIIAAICLSQIGLLWTAFVGPILAVVAFAFSIIIMPKTKEDGSPIVVEKKPKRAKHKVRKNKKPFMTEEEWKKQEEEDDEMMFIEEVVEDD